MATVPETALAQSEAQVLAFKPFENIQPNVIAMTDDSKTVRTGYTNAEFIDNEGVRIPVTEGLGAFGFGSFTPHPSEAMVPLF